MNYETTIKRDMRGHLRAETVAPLGFDRRELHITTMKHSGGGVWTHVQCVQADPDGRGFRFIVFGDFNRTLSVHRAARCTQAVIEATHATALVGLDTLLADAKAFYAAKAEPVAA